MKKRAFVLFFLVVSLPAAAALDLNPAPWRGHDRATWQYWDFQENNQTPLPDDFVNPFGALAADVYPTSGTWKQEIQGHTGVFPLSGHVFVPVNNFSEELDEKIIWIQFTWLSKGGTPNVEARANEPLPLILTVPEWTSAVLVKEELLNDGWSHSTYQVVLTPNPQQEIIHVYGSIYIDDLVIDTLCIPEPATWGLLAAGTVFLFVFGEGFERNKQYLKRLH